MREVYARKISWLCLKTRVIVLGFAETVRSSNAPSLGWYSAKPPETVRSLHPGNAQEASIVSKSELVFELAIKGERVKP